LSRVSPEFRELWARQDVLNVSEGHKTMHHPLVGELCFDFLWFQAVDARDLRILIHTPSSHTGTAEKIEWLLAHEHELVRPTPAEPCYDKVAHEYKPVVELL